MMVFDPTESIKTPPGWDVKRKLEDGKSYMNKSLGLYVIVSGAVELDGKRWIHLSVSRKSRIPTYEDIALAKKLFIGRERKAIQVFAKESEHVNIHPYCLHLWSCDEEILPDFTHGRGSI